MPMGAMDMEMGMMGMMGNDMDMMDDDDMPMNDEMMMMFMNEDYVKKKTIRIEMNSMEERGK